MKITRRGLIQSIAIVPVTRAFAELQPGESKLIKNAALNRMADPNPGQLTVALFHGDGTELAGEGYRRQPIEFESASEGRTRNADEVSFPSCRKSWGTLEGWGLLDRKGNLIAAGRLDTPKTIVVGDTVKFARGDVEISLFNVNDDGFVDDLTRPIIARILDR